MTRYVMIARCSQLTGYTEDALRTKIRDGVWAEDEVWRRAPDGRVLVDLHGYERWVVGDFQFSLPPQKTTMQRGSGSHSGRGPGPLT